MVSVQNNHIWEELDGAIWYPLVSVGSQWLGKWTSSVKGYSLIVTDGVDVWGEQRSSSYVEEKAQEWAACLEAGSLELGKLFLSQLQETSADVRIVSQDISDSLTLELTASLDLLPYSWLFYLTKLHGKIIEHHWTLPVAATLEFLSVRIKKLEEELRRKSRQLDEYLPSQAKKDPEQLLTNSIDASAQRIVTDGIGRILSEQLSHSSVLLHKIDEKRKQNQLPNSQSQSSHPHNRPKLKKPGKGAFNEEDCTERQKAEEATRRAQIQAITQATIMPTKKKKRLNI